MWWTKSAPAAHACRRTSDQQIVSDWRPFAHVTSMSERFRCAGTSCSLSKRVIEHRDERGSAAADSVRGVDVERWTMQLEVARQRSAALQERRGMRMGVTLLSME